MCKDTSHGFMGAFAKACTLALSDIPAVNASINGDEIIYHNYVDLTVATRFGHPGVAERGEDELYTDRTRDKYLGKDS